jgi:hypothetical protein
MGVQGIGAPFAMQQRKQDEDREHRERHERCGRKVLGVRPFPGLCLSSSASKRWHFIPIGQASLYVFVVHVFFIALVSDVLPFGFPLGNPHIWLNTLGHTFALASLWLMVRYQVLFRWIPH